MGAQLQQYEFIERIQTCFEESVWRVSDRESEDRVILKLADGVQPLSEDLARLGEEREFAMAIADKGVVEPLGVKAIDERAALVLGDTGGEPLSRRLEDGPLAPLALSSAGAELARIVARVHAQGVLHRDIQPANFLSGAQACDLHLIDFCFATWLAREHQTPVGPHAITGALAYMAPEQTGRLNRAVDARSDLYSLGALLYVMATGAPPFAGADALEMIHAQLALEPTPVPSVNPGVPAGLAGIIERLLAKDPDQRYQTAAGVQADLNTCHRLLQETGDCPAFTLGSQDGPGRFRIPDGLYGREAEVARLVESFERAAAGSPQVFWVAGEPGVGKSALVHELHKPVVGYRGFLTAGKFSESYLNVPYASLVLALKDLLHSILTQSDEVVAAWARTLRVALGDQGGLIAEILPELELVIGAQSTPPELSPSEAENRFYVVLRSFLGVFARPEHPLVLFLDDLQWADPSSLKILHRLASDPDLGHFLLIGAYRSEALHEAHPLSVMLNALAQDGAQAYTAQLGGLDTDAVQHLVADTCRRPVSAVTDLADVLAEKTGANPFFLAKYLESLEARGMLVYRPDLGGWHADAELVSREPLADNVVELVAQKLDSLGDEVFAVLAKAAWLGQQIELASLAEVADCSRTAAGEALWRALEAGVMVPLDWRYRMLRDSAAAVSDDVAVAFAHDRIQQAAAERVAVSERPRLHLAVGRLLWRRRGNEPERGTAFEIAAHLNAARDLITDPEERLALARLNATAARHAQASAAHEAAAGYLEAGLDVLDDGTDEALWAELIRRRAEARGLSGDVAGAEADFDQAELVATDPQSAAWLYDRRCDVLQCAGYPKEAYEAARRGLASLGVTLATGDDASDPELTGVAARLYRAYGAAGKADQPEAAGAEPAPPSSSEIDSAATSGGPSAVAGLDLESLMKAATALAGERDPDQLVQRLLQVAMENAGAERAAYIDSSDSGLVVRDARRADESAAMDTAPVALDSPASPVPASIVRYVARAREPVHLADAAETIAFAQDPWIQHHEPRSLLCQPLLHGEHLVGVLYLDNNLAHGALTPAKGEALRLLSALMAVALENAHLYRHMEEQVAERTRELERLARVDIQTGAWRRHYFLEMAQGAFDQARQSQRPLAVIMLDIDHFKTINDIYGHDGGDQILEAVSQLCIASKQSYDAFGRLGGEEFALLLPSSDSNAGHLVAERIREAVASMAGSRHPGAGLTDSEPITVSAGVAAMAPDDSSIDEVLQRADGALYEAKNNGRNQVRGIA